MATITCQDCSAKRERCPANTRYCKPCRLLRDIVYWARLRRTCRECRDEFAPLGRTDYHCSACNPGLLHLAGPCVLATSDTPHSGPPAITGIHVCAKCLRNPATRKRLIGALARGQAQRRSNNPPKEHDAG